MLSDFDVFHYTYIYTIFLSINLLLLSSLTKSHKSILIALIAVFLAQILFGLRAGNIGLDTQSYISLAAGQEHTTAKELVFTLFARSLLIESSAQLFLFLSSLLIGMIFLVSAYKTDPRSYSLTIATLLATFFYLIINISAIRQGIALGFSAFAIAQLIQGRIKSAVLIIAIAASIHHSAGISFCFILAHFVNQRALRWAISFIILACCFFAADIFILILTQLQHIHYIFSKALWYLTWDAGTPWKIKHFYYLTILFLILAFLFRKHLNKTESFLAISSLLGFAVLALTRSDEMLSDRLYYYFIFPGLACLSSILTRILKPPLQRFLVVAPVINLWFFGTAVIQYPSWFIPPFIAVTQ